MLKICYKKRTFSTNENFYLNVEYLITRYSQLEQSCSYFDDNAKKGQRQSKNQLQDESIDRIGSDRIERCKKYAQAVWQLDRARGERKVTHTIFVVYQMKLELETILKSTSNSQLRANPLKVQK